MLAGMPSARRCTKVSKEKIGKKCMSLTEKGVGLWGQRSRRMPKKQSFMAMKAANDRGKFFYDPARINNTLRRNKMRLELWEEHLKDPIVALDKALKCVEDQH